MGFEASPNYTVGVAWGKQVMLHSSYSGSPTLCDSTLFDGRKGLVSEYLPRERVRETRNLWAHDAGWTATSSFWISSRGLDFSIVSCLTTRLRLGLVFSELSSLVAVRSLSFAGSIYQLCDDRGTVKYTQRYRKPRLDSIYGYSDRQSHRYEWCELHHAW